MALADHQLALLAHLEKTIDLDGMNYVALRAYRAAGSSVSFNELNRMTGAVPVTGALIPLLVTFSDPGDPATVVTTPLGLISRISQLPASAT